MRFYLSRIKKEFKIIQVKVGGDRVAIPKTLHYCWFGGNKMPKVETKCVNRWSRFFNDYTIIRWDESNFDVNCNRYVSEAYSVGKYSYVADYARLEALYNYGGVYLDADCYVKKSFNPLLETRAFTGFGGDNREIAACTLGFEAGHPFIRECLDSYKNNAFIYQDGNLNLESINIRMTKLLQKYGFKQNGQTQTVAGIVIYPMTYFCPYSMLPDSVPDCVSRETYSIVLWTNPELRRERSFFIRFAHKSGLNRLKRKVFGE